jgi:serine/threonine protein phosphatase 1
MLKKLRTLIGAASASAASPTGIPAGERVYAIGDVHGRADLMLAMIDLIDADDAARGPAKTTVILLGDLVDRGPDSASVIALAREWGTRRNVRYLQGNHEEMFLAAFENENVLRHFLRHGGRQTLLSYPIPYEEYQRTTLTELQELMAERVPADDIAFLAAMEDMIQIGDYVFVHAGIRPGLPLDDQSASDLRWIRSDFLADTGSRDFAVVHGHTITSAPELLPRRIGVDTGAYASGQLTAIGLEGTERWLITAEGAPSDDFIDE